MLIRSEIAHKDIFEVPVGVHRFNSLVIPLRGEFDYSVGEKTKRICQGTPVVFKKGVSFRKKVISPIDYIIVSISEFPCESDCFIEFDKEERPRVKDSVERLKKAICSNAPDSITEHFANDILLASKAYSAVEKAEPSPVYKYIMENFTKNIPLTVLSRVNNTSVQTLINKFKKQYGKTPTKYITELRMKKAKKLLSDTQLSVGQIAEECGYENTYYFSNTFKKEVGTSPSKYRQSTLL